MTDQTISQASAPQTKFPRVKDEPVRDFIKSIVDAVDGMRRALSNSDGEVQVSVSDDVRPAWDYLVARMDSMSHLIDVTGREQAPCQILRLLGYPIAAPEPARPAIAVLVSDAQAIILERGAIATPDGKSTDACMDQIAMAQVYLSIAGLSARARTGDVNQRARVLGQAREAIDAALKAETIPGSTKTAGGPEPRRKLHQESHLPHTHRHPDQPRVS